MTEFNTSRVILYKNGIGNFERTGYVDKEATVELFFPADAMNDILKSITVTSTDDHKHTITYEVPTSSASSSASSSSPISTHRDLYSRLIRETVSIKTNTATTVEGMVIAVDYVTYGSEGKDSGKISIFTQDNQVVTVDVKDIASLQIPTSLVSQSKSLRINITTQSKQLIKINYIRSCPVWKPTYRAILGASQNEYKLYGWATIHNPGPDDWKGTIVSLVAGQPVSFINEVYKPKYKKRPKILSTATHNPLGISSLLVSSLLNDESDSSEDDRRKGRGHRDDRRDRNRARKREASRSASRSTSRSRSNSPIKKPLQQAASTAESEVSDLFRYDLTTPINLVRSHSALVPIFDSLVQGRKVALFNASLHKEHPFSTLVMHNNTGLSLEAGSITVFDGDMYIGEAHLTSTKPNERRFLPFALEMGVVVSSLPSQAPTQPWNRVRVDRNSVTMSRKCLNIYHYVINNKLERPIELLLEHHKIWSADPSGMSLIVEDCYFGNDKTKIDVRTEYVTTGHYGLVFAVPPRSISHLILHSQTTDEPVSVLNDRSHYQNGKGFADSTLWKKFEEAMSEHWNTMQETQELERSIRKEKDRLSELEKNQSRARENLRAAQHGSRSQNKYSENVDKLDEEISTCDVAIRSLQDKLHIASKKQRSITDNIHFDSAK